MKSQSTDDLVWRLPWRLLLRQAHSLYDLRPAYSVVKRKTNNHSLKKCETISLYLGKATIQAGNDGDSLFYKGNLGIALVQDLQQQGETVAQIEQSRGNRVLKIILSPTKVGTSRWLTSMPTQPTGCLGWRFVSQGANFQKYITRTFSVHFIVFCTRDNLTLHSVPPPGSGAVLAAVLNIMQQVSCLLYPLSC